MKDIGKAQRFKEDGNKLFITGKDNLALNAYTQVLIDFIYLITKQLCNWLIKSAPSLKTLWWLLAEYCYSQLPWLKLVLG